VGHDILYVDEEEVLVKKKSKGRNPMAGVLKNPCFKKRVVRDKTKYSRKGRAAAKQFVDGSFSL
jgi:hypothetical protein